MKHDTTCFPITVSAISEHFNRVCVFCIGLNGDSTSFPFPFFFFLGSLRKY